MEEILHQLIGSLSHQFYGFIHAGWCMICSINSMNMAFGLRKLDLKAQPSQKNDEAKYMLECELNLALMEDDSL